MNGTEAARRAGYRGNDRTLAAISIENLGKPMIREEVDRRIAKATAAANVTIEKILWELQATYEKASDAGNYSAAVRCLELQGKYLKMFSDRIEHVQSIEETTTEELMQLLREISESGGIDLAKLM
jgi:phage terminase small subunit